MTGKIRWGIVGAGNISKSFARGLAKSKTGVLSAVGSRDRDKAVTFGAEFGVSAEHCYGSYEALLADREVDAVYIATPHPMHPEWTIKAAEAGKHILCEKPVALNYPEAMAAIEAAHRHGVVFMEAFMYRCHPQTKKLVELLREKAIGEVRMIQATFSFHAGFKAESRLFSNALGGGGILDVGCYPVSLSRLVAGAALGKPFAEPLQVKATGVLGETGVDEWTAAVLKFPGNIVAQVATGVSLQQDNVVRIYGSDGWILIPSPWVVSKEGGISKIVVHKKGQKEPQEFTIDCPEWLYALEADTFAEAIRTGSVPYPGMSPEDTLGNMQVLDAWRSEIGQVYNAEKPEHYTRTVRGTPLRVSPVARMSYGRIPGIEKKISRLVMGVDNQRTIAHASVMFDDFYEQGGNVFDTAYGYGGGLSEKLLGQWIRNRGIREEVVVIGKGAHTPQCYPEAITKQLLESLERQQSGYVDLYFMHRDNLEVPVGEFVDVLNEHRNAGRIRLFGGSNWTLARLKEANAYAARTGKAGFSIVSNNLSLARMVEAPWAGCMAASDPEFKRWLTETQTPLFPWSSQARGFFVLGDRKYLNDKEMVRCWYSDDNFQRLERVRELATKKGCEPINIALAYVLTQAFPTFPLIGPRKLSETHSSLRSLEVKLSEHEVKWLNLEA